MMPTETPTQKELAKWARSLHYRADKLDNTVRHMRHEADIIATDAKELRELAEAIDAVAETEKP